MSGRIRGLVFDKDGTLFDFARTWEVWAANLIADLSRDESHATLLGAAIGFDWTRRAFDVDSIAIAGTPREVAAALLPGLPDWTGDDLVELINTEAERAPQAEIVPLIPLLGGLRTAGYRLGVATNDAERPALAHLRAGGLTAFFEFIAGSDSGHGAKPGPGPLLAFADHTGLAPAACAMIGDSRHDLIAGRAAGFTTVAVLSGMARHRDLAPLADAVLPDIGHLPDWLAWQATD